MEAAIFFFGQFPMKGPHALFPSCIELFFFYLHDYSGVISCCKLASFYQLQLEQGYLKYNISPYMPNQQLEYAA